MRTTAVATIAVLVMTATPAVAATGHRARHGSRHFVAVEAGVRLSTVGNHFEDTYRIKRSPDGRGAVIRDGVLHGTTFPATGTDTAISYLGNGRLDATETFMLGVPHTNGVGTITGKGSCTGGTRAHQDETCTYTFKGTYDLRTEMTHLTLTGTETPGASGKPTR